MYLTDQDSKVLIRASAHKVIGYVSNSSKSKTDGSRGRVGNSSKDSSTNGKQVSGKVGNKRGGNLQGENAQPEDGD